MAKLIPAAERIEKAQKLLQKAHDYPKPPAYDFTYIAEVKDFLRQATDLVKFIPMTPTATAEMKADVKKIFEEAERINKEQFRW